jgi:cysteine desulfurase / selenocysteine lyase
MITPDQLSVARALFPHTATGRIYLNHAGTSPLSTRVVAAMNEHLRSRSEGEIDTYARDIEIANRARGAVARLVNAEGADRISLQGNTSDALNVVASGLEWKTGDEIILNDLEFPANVYPYLNLKRHGVSLTILPSPDGRITPEQIERAFTSRTRLVALSAVQFLTGHRADLAAIGSLCRSRGIIFAVDGIQAVGAVRIDVQGMRIDALAAGAQKWQMGPHGTGFLYLTEELQARIHQKYLGWLSVSVPWDFQNYDQPLSPSARRFEGGTLNFPGIAGFDAALATLLEFGEGIEEQILDLTALLGEGLRAIPGGRVITPEPPGERAGIVTLELPPGADSPRIMASLEREGIYPALREGKVRYAPHFYLTRDEITRTVEATARTVGNR